MQRWGNKRANEYWEYHLPKNYNRPTETSTMADLEKFIRAKYEKKMWVRDDLRSDSEYSDYSYSYSDSDSDSNSKSNKKSARAKSKPTPKPVAANTSTSSSSASAPASSPVPGLTLASSPSPRPGLSSLSGRTGRVAGGLNGLSSRSPSSPMEELFMSLTLKSPKSVSPHDEGENIGTSCNTSSISELYGPKSPQIDVSVESIVEKRHAMQKTSRVATSSSKSHNK